MRMKLNVPFPQLHAHHVWTRSDTWVQGRSLCNNICSLHSRQYRFCEQYLNKFHSYFKHEKILSNCLKCVCLACRQTQKGHRRRETRTQSMKRDPARSLYNRTLCLFHPLFHPFSEPATMNSIVANKMSHSIISKMLTPYSLVVIITFCTSSHI